MITGIENNVNKNNGIQDKFYYTILIVGGFGVLLLVLILVVVIGVAVIVRYVLIKLYC